MDKALQKIEEASAGLQFMSESDHPFETVSFPAEKPGEPDPESLKAVLNLPAQTLIEQQELSYFLRNQTRDLPEHTSEEQMRARRFRNLEEVLKQELQEVKVFRIGETQVDAYILGKTSEGRIAGLKTRLIET